jgi:mannosyltransferase
MPPVVARRVSPPAIAGALVLLMTGSLLLRTGALHAGYWIDEAIAVGIASHPLAQIPHALAQDGSPPLYYLLLHEWIALVGTGEAATRALSEAFALLAVPVAWWAGRAVAGERAGVLAAAGAAFCPFQTYYAQETRMYSLVVVLSLAACGSFVLAFLRGRRRHVVLLGVWLVLLLYTHAWGLFLAAGMAAAWLWLWRARRVAGRDGAWLAAAVALAYAPWLPTLAFQAVHTAAPWAERPSPYVLLFVPGALLGALALLPLAVAVACALRRRPPGEAARLLAGIAATAAVAAWIGSQLQPAWATRYLAVLLGPLVLALAAVLSRGGRGTAAALAAVGAIWLLGGSAPAESNVRSAARSMAGALRPGDLVVSTQPEQVPVLYRYLPPGLRYLTPLGSVADPRQVDWRDGVARLRHGPSLRPVLRRLAPGRRILFVTPVRDRSGSAWSRLVRVRTREWSAAVTADRRLRILRPPSAVPAGRLRSGVRAELLEVR